MNPTGVPPHERQFSLFKLKASGLALLALVLGTCSTSFAESKELKDLTKPRVERVRDVDGSIWEVQIVPRPLYQPKPFCPAPLDRAEPTPAASPLVPPVPGKTDEAVLSRPAKADKKGSELISFQDEKSDKKAKKADKKDKKDKKEEKQGKEKAEAKEPPFGVDIVPRFTIPPHHPEEDCLPASPCGQIHPGDYLHVYTSIPFLRSEYIANPSYRHEATMEILFGKLRPTVVHKHPGEPRPHHTLFPFENDIIRPYSYYSLAPGAGYGRGPLPFAAPGAYGMNYNFYYPMPTVYRAY